jgi:hypothetical protein
MTRADLRHAEQLAEIARRGLWDIFLEMTIKPSIDVQDRWIRQQARELLELADVLGDEAVKKMGTDDA